MNATITTEMVANKEFWSDAEGEKWFYNESVLSMMDRCDRSGEPSIQILFTEPLTREVQEGQETRVRFGFTRDDLTVLRNWANKMLKQKSW